MSSWALFHLPWGSISRIRLRLDRLSLPFRQTKSHFTVALKESPGWEGIKRQRYPTNPPDETVFEDLTAEYATLAESSFVNRYPRSTSATLSSLVREGKYEEAERVRKELLELGIPISPDNVYEAAACAVLRLANPEYNSAVFMGWLDLLPDANSGEASSFASVLPLLLASPIDNMPFIVSFGLTCARKGYITTLQRNVLPIVQRFAPTSVYTRFLKDLEDEIGKYGYAGVTLSQRSYLPVHQTCLGADSLPSSSQSLPATLQGDDTSQIPLDAVFETLTPEYTAISHFTQRFQAVSFLKQLIRESKYDEADHLLDELQRIGLHVPKLPIFEVAAQAALRRFKSKQQIDVFSKWFSLVPSIHGRSRRFLEIRRLIYTSRATNLALIIQFGLIAASKGYGRMIASLVLPPIMRYGDPDVSSDFLAKFETAHNRYWAKHSQRDPGSYWPSKVFRDIAVKTLVFAGRLDQALTLLPSQEDMVLQKRLPLHPKIYRILLSHLLNSANQDQAVINHVQSSLQHALQLFDEQHAIPRIEVKDSVSDWPLTFSRVNLTSFLRTLKAAIRADDPPPCQTIVNFIDAYTEAGYFKALGYLRGKALRTSRHSASRWLFAELLFYRRRGLHKLLVVTFVDHYYLSGVPRDEILSRLQEWKFSMPNSRDINSRVCAWKGKIWPSSYHCSLVWHAMVGLARNSPEVQSLYETLLSYAQGQASERLQVVEELGYSGVQPLLPPPAWKSKVDHSAFTPFLRAFGDTGGPYQGARVLNDMLKLGIPPDIHQFTVLAGCYARRGYVKNAMDILNRLEQDYKPSDSIRSVEDPQSTSFESTLQEMESDLASFLPDQPTTKYTFPALNSAIYTSVITGFILSGHLEAAVDVAERMQKHLGYTPGRDRRLDAALSSLKQAVLRHAAEVCLVNN